MPPHKPADMGRRTFLRRAAATSALTLGFGAFDGLIRAAYADTGRRTEIGEAGYSPLRPVTRRDPVTGYEQELLLPEGFDFAMIGLTGTVMSDGHRTPLAHDGMAAFPGPAGTYRLVRNHEDRTPALLATPSGDASNRYDARGGGGTTTLQVRLHQGTVQLEATWQSLAGTITNCAGGAAPWGSWLSCEETTAGPTTGWEKPHGYVFEVPAHANGAVNATPLPALGRFVHEAVAIDPATGIVYLTEDQSAAGFYRFLPDRPQDLTTGRLQMLRISGQDLYDTRRGQTQGRQLPVEWVDINDPDPAIAEVNSLAVYLQGLAQGAATFSRLEGCIWGHQAVYLVATDGGDIGQGQIWELRPGQGNHGDTLTLVYESTDRAVMSFPDNITLSPKGSLLVCEDTDREDPQLIGLTPEGHIFPFCVDPSDDEWCGATFSPDGKVLFANLQGSIVGDPANPGTPGRTIAIWGPWRNGPL